MLKAPLTSRADRTNSASALHGTGIVVRSARLVTVIMTVRDDPEGCAITLESLVRQTQPADEIVVVDGGSSDRTANVVTGFAADHPEVRLIEAPGVNIARGRNIATQVAAGEIIASIDGGCRAEPDWLANLLKPFDESPQTEFVAGLYKIEPRSLLEEVVGLATMRGQLEPVDPDRFNPSGRSMAYTKGLWRRAGGWPEWVRFSEDTLFDHKLRRMNACWRFAGDAVVHWRPRGSFRSIAKQFYHYGTGRGHTQIDAPSFAYNLRNLALTAGAVATCFLTIRALVVLVPMLGYFYVWTFHHRAMRIARKTNRRTAYPLCLCVMWIVLISNVGGYLVGSWQRRWHRKHYRDRLDAYLTTA